MSPTKKSSKSIETTTQELLRKLEDQQIEIALLATPLPIVTLLEEAKIFDEPLWIAHPWDDDLYNIDNITREHVIELNFLMLPEEHCLSSQIMSIFNIKERNLRGPMKGLQASSLETILHLVSIWD